MAGLIAPVGQGLGSAVPARTAPHTPSKTTARTDMAQQRCGSQFQDQGAESCALSHRMKPPPGVQQLFGAALWSSEALSKAPHECCCRGGDLAKPCQQVSPGESWAAGNEQRARQQPVSR